MPRGDPSGSIDEAPGCSRSPRAERRQLSTARKVRSCQSPSLRAAMIQAMSARDLRAATAKEKACVALGIILTLIPTAEGGRKQSIVPGPELEYRPNWGLPGMVGTEQIGAPVYRVGKNPLAPGESARAVIVSFLSPVARELWQAVNVGDELRMFEGGNIRRKALVEWTRETKRPVPPEDDAEFATWVDG